VATPAQLNKSTDITVLVGSGELAQEDRDSGALVVLDSVDQGNAVVDPLCEKSLGV